MSLENDNRSIGSYHSLHDNLDYVCSMDALSDYYSEMNDTHDDGIDPYPKNYVKKYYSNRNKKSKYELIGKDHYRTGISEKNKKPTVIEFFMTKYYPGMVIRDAITGNYEKARVGKCDEDLYFKVKMSISNDTDGHLYYSSPEDYERHWHTELSTNIKQKWLEKYTEEFDRRKVIEENKHSIRQYIFE